MSIAVPLYGFGGGGGAALNFKVVANPQPSSPKENTIWVDTDRINNYYFSATQPEMVDDDLWFYIDTSSHVEFNALKKHGIIVYPDYVKQKVSGALTVKTAKIYQSGKWVGLSGELYEIGNQYTDITGGWSDSGWTDYAGTYTEVAATIGSSGIVLKTTKTGNYACVCGTQKTINLSGYTKIAVTVPSFSNDFWVGISQGKQFWDDEGGTPMLALKKITAKGTSNLSIPSGLSSAHVVLYGFSEEAAKTFGTVSKIRKVK